jgi:hypothetical protein
MKYLFVVKNMNSLDFETSSLKKISKLRVKVEREFNELYKKMLSKLRE